MIIAVTGGTGFIGKALLSHLEDCGHTVVKLARSDLEAPDFQGAEVVIHSAGLAHRSGKDEPSAEEFDRVNNRLTEALALKAAKAGVKRFVFVSSINVIAGHKAKLTSELPYLPLSEYGRSKQNAEVALRAMSGIETVIARPALVYGANAPGNLRALMRLCKSAAPLPLGGARNRRSFLSISNAVRALEFLASAPSTAVAGKVFNLADPTPLSTAQIVTQARAALGRKPGMLPVPASLMRSTLSAIGRGGMADQLFGNMVIAVDDIERAGFSFEDGALDIERMARA